MLKFTQLESKQTFTTYRQKKLSIEIEHKLPKFFHFKFPLGLTEYTYQRVLLT